MNYSSVYHWGVCVCVCVCVSVCVNMKADETAAIKTKKTISNIFPDRLVD